VTTTALVLLGAYASTVTTVPQILSIRAFYDDKLFHFLFYLLLTTVVTFGLTVEKILPRAFCVVAFSICMEIWQRFLPDRHGFSGMDIAFNLGGITLSLILVISAHAVHPPLLSSQKYQLRQIAIDTSTRTD